MDGLWRYKRPSIDQFLFFSLNHSLAVVESEERCVMLGTGCGNNGRLPGNARGSVEFVKLDVKVSPTQQRCQLLSKFFLLSCRDNSFKVDCFANNGETVYKLDWQLFWYRSHGELDKLMCTRNASLFSLATTWTAKWSTNAPLHQNTRLVTSLWNRCRWLYFICLFIQSRKF